MNSLFYFWTMNSPGTTIGTNVIQLVYSNSSTGVILSDMRDRHCGAALDDFGSGGDNNSLFSWSSAPGVSLSGVCHDQSGPAVSTHQRPTFPSQGSTTSFFDTNPAPQKFYEIEAIQQ